MNEIWVLVGRNQGFDAASGFPTLKRIFQTVLQGPSMASEPSQNPSVGHPFAIKLPTVVAWNTS